MGLYKKPLAFPLAACAAKGFFSKRWFCSFCEAK
jgi:hypothetical protein